MRIQKGALGHCHSWLILFFILLSGYSSSYEANAQQIHYTGSAQYATGNYFFTERTGSFYLNNGINISGRDLNLSLNIPYIAQSSPWISYSPTGPLPTGGPNQQSVNGRGRGNGQANGRIDPGIADTVNYTEGSFGDPTVSGSYKLFSSATNKTAIHGNLSMKIPFADPNTGFGTGAWDFGAGLSVAHRIGSSNIWLADVMYWQLGDMADLNFKNPISFSTGFGHIFRQGKLMFSASLFGYSSILENVDPPVSSGMNTSYQISSKVQLHANILVGMTESASDFSTGLGWRVAL